MPYLVSRIPSYDSAPTPLAIVGSRREANELIAKLESADPKGSLIFYSRVEVDAPASSFRAVKSAALSLAFAD
jgi:hypothetical protein